MFRPWLIVFLRICALTLFLVYFGYKYLTYHYGKWNGLGVPHAQPTLLFGNLADTIRGRLPLVESIHSFYNRFYGGRYFGIYESRRPILVVCDPELVHNVLVRDFSSFSDRIESKVSFKHDKLFDHLVNLRGEQWKSIRTKLSPTFSAAKLKRMLADINECTSRLVDNLNAQIVNNNGIVDVSEASAQFTTDTIGRCAFGLDCNTISNPNSEFRSTGRAIFTPTRKSAVVNFVRQIGLGRLLDVFRIRERPDQVYKFFDNLLKTAMIQHKTEETYRNDFISLLVKLQDEEKNNEQGQIIFTDDLLAANCFIFFAAGFETTASTICYCLYELAINQEIQMKLRRKIMKKLNKNNGKLSYDILSDLKYMEMVINETSRLHPQVPVVSRVCTKKYTIPDSNITLNVGEKLMIPIYSLHRDPNYYPNPEVFDPERFIEGNKSTRPHGTFLPFGDGPRICIGLRFALMEVKSGLAEILSKFQVLPCKDTRTPIKVKPRSFLLIPNEPIRLLFKSIK